MGVGDTDVAVKEVIGFDQNGDPSRTLIETTRCANARLALSESARGHLRFQSFVDVFRAFRGAASLRVVVGSAIDANEEIALSHCHETKV